jgi:hypothetical protein
MVIHFAIAILENFKDARVHYAVLKQRTNPPGNLVTPQPTPAPEGTVVAGMTRTS